MRGWRTRLVVVAAAGALWLLPGEAEAQGGQVGFTSRRPAGLMVGQLARDAPHAPRRARAARRGAGSCTPAQRRRAAGRC